MSIPRRGLLPRRFTSSHRLRRCGGRSNIGESAFGREPATAYPTRRKGRSAAPVTYQGTQTPATEIEHLIEEATHRLVEAAHPEKIILFGSYARGDFDKRSDLDLLIILPEVES